jgi:hypothetical protein
LTRAGNLSTHEINPMNRMLRITLFATGVLVLLFGGRPVRADNPDPAPMHMAAGVHGMTVPREGGQGAIAAIQEIIGLLEADPATDWTQVRIEALRKHLIDMSELTLRAQVSTGEIPGGFAADVTGQGRTLDAIRRMVPEHVQLVDGYRGWSVRAEHTDGGYRLTATAGSAAESAHLRGLGFIGVMASQEHHPEHHWMIATGRPMGG